MRTHLGLRGLLFHGSGVPSSCGIQAFPGTGSVASWDEYGPRSHTGMISAPEATGQHWENAPAWNLACSWRNVRKYRTSRMRDRLGNRKQVSK